MKRKNVWCKTVYSYAPEEERDTVDATDYGTKVSIFRKRLGGWEVITEECHSGTLPACFCTCWQRCGCEWFNAYRDALRYAEDVVVSSERREYVTIFRCRSEWRR